MGEESSEYKSELFLTGFWGVLLVRPSQTTSAAGRLFSSAGSPKPLVGRTDAEPFFFPYSPFHPPHWLIYSRTMEIRLPISIRECVWTPLNILFPRRFKDQLFVFLFTSRPLLVQSPESCFTTTADAPKKLCDDSSIDAIILPCGLFFLLFFFSSFFHFLLIYGAKFKWIMPNLNAKGRVFKCAVKAFAFERAIPSNGDKSLNLALKNEN